MRELREEILVTPTQFVEVAVLSDPRPDAGEEAAHHIYLVTAWEGDGPVEHNHEHSELRWFRPSEAIDLPLAHPDYRPLLRQLR